MNNLDEIIQHGVQKVLDGELDCDTLEDYIEREIENELLIDEGKEELIKKIMSEILK